MYRKLLEIQGDVGLVTHLQENEMPDAEIIEVIQSGKPGNWIINVFIILGKVAKFSAEELLTNNGQKVSLPGKFNLFKWFKIAKFFVVIVIDVVRASKGKTVEFDYGFNKGDLDIKNLKHG